MSEPFLGEIEIFGFNFAPRGWAQCNGQLLPINQYQALFSLLGTSFGGDGVRTFALPDLRGRVAVGQGQGNGLTQRPLGATGGEETHTLSTAEVPAHNHMAGAVANPGPGGTFASPSGNLPSVGFGKWSGESGPVTFYANTAPNVTMNPATISTTPAALPHSNLMPFQVLTPCIALNGIFPSRN